MWKKGKPEGGGSRAKEGMPRKERKERECQGSESPTAEASDWAMAVGASGWATAESTSMSMAGVSGQIVRWWTIIYANASIITSYKLGQNEL